MRLNTFNGYMGQKNQVPGKVVGSFSNIHAKGQIVYDIKNSVRGK